MALCPTWFDVPTWHGRHKPIEACRFDEETCVNPPKPSQKGDRSHNGGLHSDGMPGCILPASIASTPIASLSLDLDNQWSYMKIHGDAGWDRYPSYFDLFIPHVLELLDQLNLKITFFIVGRDASMAPNQEYLQEITLRGHEVGNHSFNHESWMHRYSHESLIKEIDNAHAEISRVTGHEPVGFRGPGFSWSMSLFEVLSQRGYVYDASTLPTYIGPLARMYYFWKSDLSKEEKKDRNELFGSFMAGRHPVKPYLWQLNSGEALLEIPVTTIPIIKIPFHLSYLLYLSRFSINLMNAYLQSAIALCRITGISPSFLLHPLDLVGGDKLKVLSFFPGMDLPSDRKEQIFCKVIKTLSTHFKLVNMSTHANHLKRSGNLKRFSPDKSQARG